MKLRLVRFFAATTIGSAAFTICSEAQAFFPPVDPNQGRVVTTPNQAPITTAQTTSTTSNVRPAPVNPVKPTQKNDICTTTSQSKPTLHKPIYGGKPCDVPEPATIISGLIGLSAVGLLGLRRKRKPVDDEQNNNQQPPAAA